VEDTRPCGDGGWSVAQFDVYEATVLWDRKRRLIFVNETDSIPLVGTALMEGYALNIQFRPGGKVTLTRMS
jgi:predicted aspartyl protease